MYWARSQCRPCSWLASTSSSATVVITAAKPSRNSSELRRFGSGGMTATGDCGCVVMTLPGSSFPAPAVGEAALSRWADGDGGRRGGGGGGGGGGTRRRRRGRGRGGHRGRGLRRGCVRPASECPDSPGVSGEGRWGVGVGGRGGSGRGRRRTSGSTELRASSSIWAMASSSVPDGRPATTCARSDGRMSLTPSMRQSRLSRDCAGADERQLISRVEAAQQIGLLQCDTQKGTLNTPHDRDGAVVLGDVVVAAHDLAADGQPGQHDQHQQRPPR